ncbi:MAG: ABC transporter permease, partial [Clostridium sp.]
MSREHEKYMKKVKKDKVKLTFFRVILLVLFIAIWEVSARLSLIDPFLTSSPLKILEIFIKFLNEGNILNHIWVTCYETIIGFSLGTSLGVTISTILWACPFTAKVLDPYLVVLNALPKIALAPIIIFWVGNGTSAII